MANPKPALAKTLVNEGFYSNTPGDNGGETLWGIARVPNPTWEGWSIVDSLRSSSDFPNCLKHNAQLLELRDKFYIHKYWDIICGDDIINQESANELFDSSVNMGTHQAIVLTKRALSIAETGHMDILTLTALNTANPYA